LVDILYHKKTDCFSLGNLESQRDIGHAKEYVEGMWRMLQQDQPEDFVLATGKTHTIRSIVETTARILNVDIEWEGTGINEVGKNKETGEIMVKVDPKYFRPSEVDLLIGDATKAKEKLGWTYSMSLDEILREMVNERIK